MDLLQKATNSFSRLLDCKYNIIIGKNKKLFAYELSFDKYDFKHIAGLHKLTDIPGVYDASSEKLYDDITKLRLDSTIINNSEYGAEPLNRLNNIIYLEDYLDNAQAIYQWNKDKSPFSSVDADIMIKHPSTAFNNETAYIFFKSYDNNKLKITDFFTDSITKENPVSLFSTKRDYTKGQMRPPKLLYKSKIDKTTGTKTVFLDELSKQTANNSLTKPDNPMYNIVKNLNTISSDKILNHPEALTDLYELTLQEKPTTDIIYQISHETKQPFDSFGTFTSNKAALEQAYNHITDIENKPAFADTYDRLEKFITPFRDKDPNSLIWSTEAARWERFLEYGSNTNKPLTTISPSPPSTTVNNNTSTSKPNNDSINNKPQNVVKSSRFNSVINDSSFAPQDISPAFDPSNPYN